MHSSARTNICHPVQHVLSVVRDHPRGRSMSSHFQNKLSPDGLVLYLDWLIVQASVFVSCFRSMRGASPSTPGRLRASIPSAPCGHIYPRVLAVSGHSVDHVSLGTTPYVFLLLISLASARCFSIEPAVRTVRRLCASRCTRCWYCFYLLVPCSSQRVL